MKRRTDREKRDSSADLSSVEWWARECPGQFLYVITFGPEPRRRRRRKRPAPVVPPSSPAMLAPGAPVIEPAEVAKPVPRKRMELI